LESSTRTGFAQEQQRSGGAATDFNPRSSVGATWCQHGPTMTLLLQRGLSAHFNSHFRAETTREYQAVWRGLEYFNSHFRAETTSKIS
jgi:hypothetical protein